MNEMISGVAYIKCMKGLAILLVLFAGHAFAQQNPKIDSLEKALAKLPDDSSKIVTLIHLSQEYRNRAARKSVALAYKAIELSKQFQEGKMLSQSYGTLGIAYGIYGNLDSSLWAFKKQLASSEKKHDHVSISSAHTNIGITYAQQSNYDSAVKSFYRSLEIREEFGMSNCHNYGSIADVYNRTGDFQSAAHFDTLALADIKKHHLGDNLNFLLLGNHATTLYNLGKYQEARTILYQCIAYRKKKDDKFYLSNHFMGLGNIDLKEEKYDQAFSNYMKTLKLKEAVDNVAGIADVYEKLAATEFGRRRMQSAMRFAKKSLRLFDSLNLTESNRNVTKIMMMIACSEQDFAQAHYYDSMFTAAQEALNLEEQSRVIAEVSTKYESEKKEKENQLLKLKQLKQSAELSTQRYTIILIGVILIAVTFFLIVVYRSRYIFKKTNALLKATNEAVQMQQREILRQKEQLADQMQELKKTQSQLVHAEKMASLGQMTSGIAHEINNPLNFITGGVEGLKSPVQQLLSLAKGDSKLRSDEIQEMEAGANRMIDIIDNGVRRVHRIITSLRTFSSPQGAITTVNVLDILEMALTLLNNKIVDSHVIVVKKYNVESAMVRGNPSELSQVFSNIIDNAVQAMEDNDRLRQLTIGLEVHDKDIIVIIADTGSGIAPEIQHKIMEPFFTTKDVGRGTGLGLSISYNIIKNHEGQITFNSKPNAGTEFIVSLKMVNDGKQMDATSARV